MFPILVFMYAQLSLREAKCNLSSARHMSDIGTVHRESFRVRAVLMRP